MKKTSFIVLLTVLAVTGKLAAQSDSYTPWQMSATVGFANPRGEGTKGGVSLYLEPMFHINNHVSVGIRTGVALVGKAKLDAAGQPTDAFSVAGVFSYLATGNYYFQFSPGAKFRPYAGIGMGFSKATGVAGTNAVSVDASSGFGGMARMGFDLGHFCFNAEYALNPKTEKLSSNYFGINLGVYLGGGSQR